MSKLLMLFQLLASSGLASSGHVVQKTTWPKRLMRRAIGGLCLLVIGCILFGSLITTGLFWGYQNALDHGYSSDRVLLFIVLTIIVLFIGIGIALNYCVQEIKNQFKPFANESQQPLTTQITNAVQDALKGFLTGFIRRKRQPGIYR